MEMLSDMGAEVLPEKPEPGVGTTPGPGGLQNMSQMSRMVARKGKEEAPARPAKKVQAPERVAKLPSVEELADAAAQSRRREPPPVKERPKKTASSEDEAQSSSSLAAAAAASSSLSSEEDPIRETTTPPRAPVSSGPAREDEMPEPLAPLDEMYEAPSESEEVLVSFETRAARAAAVAAVAFATRRLVNAPLLALTAAVVGAVAMSSQRVEPLAAKALAYARDSDAPRRAKEAWLFLDDRAPRPAKQLMAAVFGWRLLGLLCGQRQLAASFRGLVVSAATLVGCFAYVPLFDDDKPRGLMLVVGAAAATWAALRALDACVGHDASAALACGAWLAKPSVSLLRAKLKATLRTRDLGVALLATDVLDDDRSKLLYLGCFGHWFLVCSSSGLGGGQHHHDAHLLHQRGGGGRGEERTASLRRRRGDADDRRHHTGGGGGGGGNPSFVRLDLS